MDTVFENFTVSVLRLNKLVQRIKQYEMAEYGLKAIHMMCVYYLAHRPDGLTAVELSKLTLEDKAAISRALRVLRQKGYVAYDSQRYNAPIRLTDAGRALSVHLDARADCAVQAGKDNALSDEDRMAFYATLGKISANLETYYEELLAKKS